MAEYIEREAFIDRYRKLLCEDCDRRKGMKNGKMRFCYEIGEAPCRACSVDDMLSYVDDFPAADVQTVRYGRWGHRWVCSNMTGYVFACSCSECGNPTYRISTLEPMPPYCPNCGASMTESEVNNNSTT